jgi:UDP-N-acetylglucosamine 2-epimerase (non-hydrolysing)/UDP-GlcNAc3NAcA epimerase
LKVLTVIGNRPQFVKAAAVSRTLRAEHEEWLVHTGQHHDDDLSDVFFEELRIPRPEIVLGIHGGTNTSQTARMLEALEPLVRDVRPDAALVYGDTNSTLAGGLAAAQAGIPVAHVEAGMRSFDRRMPEELNRVLTDHLSDLLLASSDTAVTNLRNEHVSGAVELVGDVMVDMAYAVQPVVRDTPLPASFPKEFVLATAHRAGNVDDPARLRALFELLFAVPVKVILPLHPRTRARLEDANLLDEAERRLFMLPPLGYLDFTSLLLRAKAVFTDSGGVQKEAYLAGVPCVTLRDTTEWVETVEHGWNVLVELDRAKALSVLERPLPEERPELYGDGKAGERVVAAMAARYA